MNENKLNEQMLEAHRNLLHAETHLIDSFVREHNFRMQVTGSGLRYEILKKGKQRKAMVGDEVMIRYKAWLLDGTLCQETKDDKPQILILGKGMQIKGVEEALLLLSEGETARLIVPSHLAYGMRGDGKSIPAAASVYYEFTLIAIKK